MTIAWTPLVGDTAQVIDRAAMLLLLCMYIFFHTNPNTIAAPDVSWIVCFGSSL